MAQLALAIYLQTMFQATGVSKRARVVAAVHAVSPARLLFV